MLLVNHSAKTVENVFSEPSEQSIEESVDELLKEEVQHARQEVAREISLTPVIIRGKPATQTIEGCLCTKYAAKYTVVYERQQTEEETARREPVAAFSPARYQSFADYFADSVISFDFSRATQPASELPQPSTQRESQTSRRPLPADRSEKKYKATVWICHHYPLKYSQFAPLIHVLSYTSPHIAKFAEFFAHNLSEDDGFPVRVRVPLFYTVSANLTLTNLKFESVSSEFMNVDAKYAGGPRGCARITSSPEVKLYSPISKACAKDVRSFAQATERNPEYENLADPNDRLRWTSYESDENDESILRAQAQFECLLNQAEPGKTGKEEEEEEDAVVVQIVQTPDEEQKAVCYSERPVPSVDTEKNEDESEEEIVFADDEQESTCARSAAENIKTHSIPEVKTLRDVAWQRRTLQPENMCKKSTGGKSPATRMRLKNEENMKKLHQHRPSKFARPQPLSNRGDSIQTLKKPFNTETGVSFLSKCDKKTEAKTARHDLDGLLDGLKRMGSTRNAGEGLRPFIKGGKMFETARTYKKTIDVDVVLMKKKPLL